MAKTQLKRVIRTIRQLSDRQVLADLTDGQLLRHFHEDGNEEAFAAIVERHGSMVLGVCRRVVSQQVDAEDAFQATFLILARKASTIRKVESLAGWLHGVAQRVALNARRSAMRRRQHESVVEERTAESPAASASLKELQLILDDEVQRLPERYRIPFVLVCLEGMSKPDAAKAMSCKEGTVSSRLARARETLQQRLLRRGVALASALGAIAATGETASAGVPTVLAESTVKAASAIAGGGTAINTVVSASVAGLVERTIKTMMIGKLKMAMTAVLLGVCGSAALAYGLLSSGGPVNSPAKSEEHRKDGQPGPNGDLKDDGFIALDGSDKAVRLDDYGYKVEVTKMDRRVSIIIALKEHAAKSFETGRLTLKRGDVTIVETDVGLERAGITRNLELDFDPRLIDGGELLIHSSRIEGQPRTENFRGFRLSIRKLLEAENPKKDEPDFSWQAPIYKADEPRKLGADLFDKVRSGMTFGELVELLGPVWVGTMNTQSGGIVLWRCEDGRELRAERPSGRKDDVLSVEGGTGNVGKLTMTRIKDGRAEAFPIPPK